jgi:hypothetical protein
LPISPSLLSRYTKQKKSPLRIGRRRAFLNLVSWPLLAGIVRRHARHVMMGMTMMVGADLHI